ncbi:STAS domain-containing protein [Flavivirga abyssicola]|uniref:STAS domain-containing protein n=1 Tax=Flavivirga abyssicola TaxID=3063533 RepID=UPI0026E0C990|nr:STAS domain-containing protein [Flavivirga sp. MEBiC07777]WVK13254.1 STAS domain-containing protein [Flavivirga sp. MEBiC07777]
MALKITDQNGTFLVEGTINTTTALNFQNHLEAILNTYETLTIDIENVTEIDASGMQALRALYNNALIYNRPFYIVGTGCKEVYDDFIFTYAA